MGSGTKGTTRLLRVPQAHRSQESEQDDVFGHGFDVGVEQRNSENGTGPRSDSSQDDDQEQSRASDRPPRRRRRRRRGRRTRDGEVVGNDGQRSGEEESEESDEVKVNHQAAEKPFTEHDSGEMKIQMENHAVAVAVEDERQMNSRKKPLEKIVQIKGLGPVMQVGNGDRTVVVAVVEKPAVEATEKVDAVERSLVSDQEEKMTKRA